VTVSGKLQALRLAGWDVRSYNFAEIIIEQEFEKEMEAILDVLLNAKFSIANSIIKRGGGLADQTQELTRKFDKIGTKNNISVTNKVEFQKTFPTISSNSTSHEIDHLVQNVVGQFLAIELEWNNKDEFFDRDFQSIRRLYDLGIIEAGIIVTRGQSLEGQLLPFVKGYFDTFPVTSFNDFDVVKKNFPIPASLGEYCFSFPTSSQKLNITKKIKGGRKKFSDASAEVFVSSKFAATTTNWRQLQKRICRRDMGRTPLLCIGIPGSVFY
jgi:hypothetical protein